MTRKLAVALIAGAALCLMTAAIAQGAAPGGPPTTPGQTGPAFTDHGIVQKNPRVVLVFWGWQGTAFQQAELAAVRSAVRHVGHSAYGGILAQYGVHDDMTLGGIVTDTRPPPDGALSHDDFAREVLRAHRLSGLPATFDTQWTVFPVAGAVTDFGGGECGEHDVFRHRGRYFAYSVIQPFDDPNFSGCGATMASVTQAWSHEAAEEATNTLWWDNDGWYLRVGAHGLQEIGDICDGQSVRPWGPSGPTVQALWSNASEGPNRDRGCVQSAGGGQPR